MEGKEAELAPVPECLDSEYPEVAWALRKTDGDHHPITIPRPKVTDFAVRFELLYSGICHSDLHTGRSHWGPCQMPFVGGHELLGKVTEIGSKVTKFKVGDICAVGCFIDSCGGCEMCKDGNEQYCYKGMTGTYNGAKKHGRVGGNQDTKTFGGYSASNVVHEDYVIKIPDGMDLTKTAPIMCAGITMYSPLNHWGASKGGMTVGIVGIGGLGTMGVKLAKALGNKVVAISTSAKKEAMAKEKGADAFVVTSDPESVKANESTCDLILNTVSAAHDINLYVGLLKKSGTIVQLGGVVEPHSISQFGLMLGRKSIAGSLIGGIKETQEVIDLCAAKNIYPDCKVVEAKDIDACWKELDGSNPDGVRYVIDIKKSLENKDFLPK